MVAKLCGSMSLLEIGGGEVRGGPDRRRAGNQWQVLLWGKRNMTEKSPE